MMHYAAQQAGMQLASKYQGAAASTGKDQGRTTGGGASTVVLVHEQAAAAALTAWRDPCKDAPTLKVGPQ
jgi:hypothetical protein